jgi:hypothetical protein
MKLPKIFLHVHQWHFKRNIFTINNAIYLRCLVWQLSTLQMLQFRVLSVLRDKKINKKRYTIIYFLLFFYFA